MWNEKEGYINKKDLEICKKYAVKVDVKIVKIYCDTYTGLYYMYYLLDDNKVYKSIIDYELYAYLKDYAKVLTSQKLSRLREKEEANKC